MDKEALKVYHREWYAKQTFERKAHKVELQRKRRREIREWIVQTKGNLHCEKCSESHLACLDFHHKDPSEKEISLSNAVTHGWSKERILKEMQKCVVLCSNCHRKFHFDEIDENQDNHG